jgi:hypothetical protein
MVPAADAEEATAVVAMMAAVRVIKIRMIDFPSLVQKFNTRPAATRWLE